MRLGFRLWAARSRTARTPAKTTPQNGPLLSAFRPLSFILFNSLPARADYNHLFIVWTATACKSINYNPMLFRCWSTRQNIRPAFLAAMSEMFAEAEFANMSLRSIVTHVYASIAKSYSIVMAETMTSADRADLSDAVKKRERRRPTWDAHAIIY